jgi:hypothetical protein
MDRNTGLEENTMKRLNVLFVGLMVIALVLAACRPEPAELPDSTPLPTVVGEQPADLEILPVIEGQSTTAGGFGGGGGDGRTTEDASISMPIDFEPVDVFSGTQFSLVGTLPIDLTSAHVLRQRPWVMDVATARQLANQFGFSGQLFMNAPYTPPPGEAALDIPPTYFVFDGSRRLQLDSFMVYYDDPSVTANGDNPTAYEQAGPLAESFLQSKGLLNFAYEMRSGFGPGEVYFHRVVDGKAVNQYEIWVRVSNGAVATVGYSVLTQAEDLGAYPLIAADAAFQQLQAGIAANSVPWEMVSSPSWVVETPVEDMPIVDEPFQSWMRQYAPGEEVHFYTWPTVYIAAEGDGVPHVETYPFTLAADEQLLRAIGASGNQMWHFWGTIGSDSKTLNVAGSEPLDGNTFQSLFLRGLISRVGDQVRLTTAEGQSYILPGAPADLPDALEVEVFAMASRDAGLELPILDWDSIYKYIAPEEPVAVGTETSIEPLPADWQPHVYSTVNVERAELVYYYTYVQDEQAIAEGRYAPATILVQPAWKFTGTADNGDVLSFYVQAVAPEYIGQ